MSRKGTKYAFWDEVNAFAARGQTVVVYHHLHRLCPSSKQLDLLRQQTKERMPHGFVVSAVVFRRGTRRAYFILKTAVRRGHRQAGQDFR